MSTTVATPHKTVVRKPRAQRISQSKPKVIKIKDMIKGPAIKVQPKQVDLRWTFGSDPELGLFDHQVGKIVSAIPVLKRSKHDPIDLGDGIKFYFDNVQTELAFPPSDSKEEMIARLKTVFVRAHEHLGDRYSLAPQTVHVYSDEELNDTTYGDAREVGCNPSYSALTISVNPPNPFPDNMRTASFHIHLGNKDWNGNHDDRMLSFDSRHDVIRLFNIYTGLASVIFDKDEGFVKRRAIYGKAFEFRPCPYGCEARTLGPYALRTPELTELVLDLTNHAMTHVKNRTENDILSVVDLEAVNEAINTCNKGLAQNILDKLDLPSQLMARVKKLRNA